MACDLDGFPSLPKSDQKSDEFAGKEAQLAEGFEGDA
jgi:hypothetical protein